MRVPEDVVMAITAFSSIQGNWYWMSFVRSMCVGVGWGGGCCIYMHVDFCAWQYLCEYVCAICINIGFVIVCV